MSYIVSINPSLWSASSQMEGKEPKSFKSSLLLKFAGDNVWAANASITIDSSGAGLGTVIFNIANLKGSDRVKGAEQWVNLSGIPTVGAPFITLDATWLPNKTLSVVSETYSQELVEGVDFQRDVANHRINFLRSYWFETSILVAYWKANSAPSSVSNLETTVQNFAKAINSNSDIIGVRAVTGNGSIWTWMDKYSVQLEAVDISEDSDTIEVTRANIAGGRILINGLDVNGPVTLCGNATNLQAIAASIKVGENNEFYIEGVPGSVISVQHPKEFEDVRFEGFSKEIKSDLAEFVAKDILIVMHGGAALTADEVLHSGYDDVKVVV